MQDTPPTRAAAILGRWQPPHLGHQAALLSLCDQFDQVIIGIGSCNIDDYRNPFTFVEVKEMLDLVLRGIPNYDLVPIPDVIDDLEWRQSLPDKFGSPNFLVTANPYVQHLVGNQFKIAHPASFIPEDRKVPVSATMIRREMARGTGWMSLVPEVIAAYISDRHLDQRFRQKYGLHTLALETIIV